MNTHFTYLVLFISLADCRDFYVGMFKKNDFLVAQDRLYKEKIPFRLTYAKYGRLFKCPITYFRVVDRLGVGRGPRVEIIRGGLQKKFLVLRLTSSYNLPISVNIYVGCENTMTTVTTTPILETTLSQNEVTTASDNHNHTTGDDATGATDDKKEEEGATTPGEGDGPTTETNVESEAPNE